MHLLKKPFGALVAALCLVVCFSLLTLEARAYELYDVPATTEEAEVEYELEYIPENTDMMEYELEDISEVEEDSVYLPPIEIYTPPPVTVNDVISVRGDPFANEIIRLVNIERFHAGVAPVAEHSALTGAARVRSQEGLILDTAQFISHIRPNGYQWYRVLYEMDLPVAYFMRAGAGENVARGFCTPEQVVQAWMNSPAHRANMLSPTWVTTGLGVSANEWGRIDVVQLFFGDNLSPAPYIAIPYQPEYDTSCTLYEDYLFSDDWFYLDYDDRKEEADTVPAPEYLEYNANGDYIATPSIDALITV